MDGYYTADFYRKRQELTLTSAEVVLDVLYKIIQPHSVIDFGCATGTWLVECEKQGSKEILGVDGAWVNRDLIEIDRDRFITHDFGSSKFSSMGKYDLALCIEVAEHLSPEMGDHLIDTITETSDIVLFSAAVKGQGGTGHINEQPQHYWANRFFSRGYVGVELIRPKIWDHEHVNMIYKQNMIVYMTKPLCKDLKLEPLIISGEFNIDRVHPDLFELRSVESLTAFSKKILYGFNLISKGLRLK